MDFEVLIDSTDKSGGLYHQGIIDHVLNGSFNITGYTIPLSKNCV
jgi:hypothetical protein